MDLAKFEGRPIDDVLAAYLRVINDKDEEIHRLLVELERLNFEMRQRDDKHKARMREVKSSLLRLQESAASFVAKEERLGAVLRENEALKGDIDRLKAALAAVEGQLQSVLKANEKAVKHEQHARKKMAASHESEKNEAAERDKKQAAALAVLEGQLTSLKARLGDGDKDVVRWKVEAQRLQEEAAEAHRVVRELKREMKLMRPTSAFEAEAAHAETRHKNAVEELERQLGSMRTSLKEVTDRANGFEIRLVEAQHRGGDAQRELQTARQSLQDTEFLLSQARLDKAQSLEDVRGDHKQQVAVLQRQIDTLYGDKVTNEGELALKSQRIADLESAAASAADRFRNDEQRLSSELNATRSNLDEAVSTGDAHRRRADQLDHQLSVLSAEHADLKDDLRRAQADVKRGEETRQQLQGAMRTEQELRHKIQLLEASLREKDNVLSERRGDLEDLRREHQAAETRRQHEINDLREQLSKTETALGARERELAETGRKLAATERREQVASEMLSELDEGLQHQKASVKERDRQVEALHSELSRLQPAHEKAVAELALVSDALAREKGETSRLSEHKHRLEGYVHQKELEIEALNADVRRVERAATDHEEELSRQLEQARLRAQELAKEVHVQQQQTASARLDVSKSEAKAVEKLSEVQSKVVEPLQKRVDELSVAVSRLGQDVGTREQKIKEAGNQLHTQADLIEKLREEIISRDRRINTLEDDKHAAKTVQLELTRVQRDLHSERENTRKMGALETRIADLTKELHGLRDRESNALADASARRSEAATWKERCANLESLRAIAETAVEEYKSREREMLEKIEEMHHTQQVMQTCFNKQQEQIEFGERLRTQKLRGEN